MINTRQRRKTRGRQFLDTEDEQSISEAEGLVGAQSRFFQERNAMQYQNIDSPSEDTLMQHRGEMRFDEFPQVLQRQNSEYSGSSSWRSGRDQDQRSNFNVRIPQALHAKHGQFTPSSGESQSRPRSRGQETTSSMADSMTSQSRPSKQSFDIFGNDPYIPPQRHRYHGAESPIYKTKLLEPQQLHVMFSDEDIKEAFTQFDLDSNGYIGAEEIRAVMENMGEYATDEEIDEMIRMLDYEGIGQVAFPEFYKMATGQLIGPTGAALPPSPNMMAQIQSVSPAPVSDKTSEIAPVPSTKTLTSRKVTEASQLKRSSFNESKISLRSQILKSETDSKLSFRRNSKSELDSIMRAALPSPKEPPIAIETRAFNIREKFPSPRLRPLETSQEIPESPEWKDLSDSNVIERNLLVPSVPATEEKEMNVLIAQLVHQTFFTPGTIEKLIRLFIEGAGSHTAKMSYTQFLRLVNSRLPEDRPLSDDRVTRRIFKVLDSDGDDCLDLKDFVTGMSILTRQNKEEQFKLVFRLFDADDDGSITLNELTRILKLNTASVKSDDQALKKAQDIMRMVGNHEYITMEAFLTMRDKPVMLLFPLQERARKISRLVQSQPFKNVYIKLPTQISNIAHSRCPYRQSPESYSDPYSQNSKVVKNVSRVLGKPGPLSPLLISAPQSTGY